MQITDPIADLLTRIRNANSAKHETVEIPASNMKKAIVEILDEEGYINAENAQALLKNELGVTEFESYNGDTTPRNDCYTIFVKAGDVEGGYLINAVTGLITEIVDEEPAEPDYIEEEDFDPSFEEEAEETIDEDVDVEIPEEEPAE